MGSPALNRPRTTLRLPFATLLALLGVSCAAIPRPTEKGREVEAVTGTWTLSGWYETLRLTLSPDPKSPRLLEVEAGYGTCWGSFHGRTQAHRDGAGWRLAPWSGDASTFTELLGERLEQVEDHARPHLRTSGTKAVLLRPGAWIDLAPSFEGTVLNTGASETSPVFLCNGGSEDGLRRGNPCTVLRGDTPIGMARIETVLPFLCSAVPEEDCRAVRPGDRVLVHLMHRLRFDPDSLSAGKGSALAEQ